MPEGARAGMTDDGLLSMVLEVIRPVTGPVDDLDADSALLSFGLESLALMEMRARLKQHFGSPLPMTMLTGGASLRQIAGFYGRSSGNGGMASQAFSAEGEPGGARTSSAGAGMSSTRTDPVVVRPALDDAVDTDVVVTLRDGTGPVLALVHPVGGDVFCYAELASLWPGDAKVIGVRHPEAESGTPTFRTHGELAQLYRHALFAALGEAPDIVGGWSFGASIAQEMAAQWEAEGRPSPASSPSMGRCPTASTCAGPASWPPISARSIRTYFKGRPRIRNSGRSSMPGTVSIGSQPRRMPKPQTGYWGFMRLTLSLLATTRFGPYAHRSGTRSPSARTPSGRTGIRWPGSHRYRVARSPC